MSEDLAPTAEDMTLDPARLLAVCSERIRRGWTDLPMFADPNRTIAALCRRLLATQAENERLRRQIEGHCERIAAASEVIAKNAERSPLLRLGAWLETPARRAKFASVEGQPAWLHLEQAGGTRYMDVVVYAGCGESGLRNFYAGTAERNATPAEMLAVALTEWESLYGEKKDG